MVEEAQLRRTACGLEPATAGWFTVNVRDAAWVTNEAFGAACIFEGDDAEFEDIGFTLGVIPPGRPSAMYHRESNQENFLVLRGECLLLIEGQERRLAAWDFVHCPPGTDHIFVGLGEEPCLVFMIGGRTGPKATVYPRSDFALRHGAGVETETTESKEAYAPYPPWKDGPPPDVTELFA
jgi:uncharacterized cupin superfamily protein